ncbi:hypothetical protein [Nostoc sp. JL33]|uniref:hypothetical protein n=1 Tax=Nostoc sp. JL33 TaxID=2815396 RepID=UPI0025CB8933|nr:hypothetical protein [Nostoc sp. JL33]MBN3870918.1 hypothetical protein [Nostoc sp. JL33]
MSNLDNITSNSNYSVVSQEQLFTELTLEEGAVIEGGAIYNLGNKSGITVNYLINGRKDFLYFNDERQYDFRRPPTVSFDQKIGPGYDVVNIPLSPGTNNFDTSEGYLILTGGSDGPGANVVPAAANFASGANGNGGAANLL